MVTAVAKEAKAETRKNFPIIDHFLQVIVVGSQEMAKSGKKVPAMITDRYIKKYNSTEITALYCTLVQPVLENTF